jgi:hypothetical protein
VAAASCIVVMGYARSRWLREATQQEVAIWRLRKSDLSYSEIAREVQCTRGVVAAAIARFRHGRVTLPHPRRSGCRWVHGDPRQEWGWCDAPVIGEGAWCSEHRARVYRPFNPKVQFNVV